MCASRAWMRSISEIQIPPRPPSRNGIPAPAAIGRTPRLMIDVARPGHDALLESALGSVVGGSLKTRPRVRERRCLTGVCVGSAERSAEPRAGEFNRRRPLRDGAARLDDANVLVNDRLLGTFAERQERRRLLRDATVTLRSRVPASRFLGHSVAGGAQAEEHVAKPLNAQSFLKRTLATSAETKRGIRETERERNADT